MSHPQIQQAIEIIHPSERIIAFSGAGISTEAGIPDFRGKAGLWETGYEPQRFDFAGGSCAHSQCLARLDQ